MTILTEQCFTIDKTAFTETSRDVGENGEPILLDNGKERCHTIISNCIVSTLYDMHDLPLDCRLHAGHNALLLRRKQMIMGKRFNKLLSTHALSHFDC